MLLCTGVATAFLQNGTTYPRVRAPWYGYLLFQSAVSPVAVQNAGLGTTISKGAPGRLATVTKASATRNCDEGKIKIWPIVHESAGAETEVRVVVINKGMTGRCLVTLTLAGSYKDGTILRVLPQQTGREEGDGPYEALSGTFGGLGYEDLKPSMNGRLMPELARASKVAGPGTQSKTAFSFLVPEASAALLVARDDGSHKWCRPLRQAVNGTGVATCARETWTVVQAPPPPPPKPTPVPRKRVPVPPKPPVKPAVNPPVKPAAAPPKPAVATSQPATAPKVQPAAAAPKPQVTQPAKPVTAPVSKPLAGTHVKSLVASPPPAVPRPITTAVPKAITSAPRPVTAAVPKPNTAAVPKPDSSSAEKYNSRQDWWQIWQNWKKANNSSTNSQQQQQQQPSPLPAAPAFPPSDPNPPPSK